MKVDGAISAASAAASASVIGGGGGDGTAGAAVAAVRVAPELCGPWGKGTQEDEAMSAMEAERVGGGEGAVEMEGGEDRTMEVPPEPEPGKGVRIAEGWAFDPKISQ